MLEKRLKWFCCCPFFGKLAFFYMYILRIFGKNHWENHDWKEHWLAQKWRKWKKPSIKCSIFIADWFFLMISKTEAQKWASIVRRRFLFSSVGKVNHSACGMLSDVGSHGLLKHTEKRVSTQTYARQYRCSLFFDIFIVSSLHKTPESRQTQKMYKFFWDSKQ